MRAVAFDAKQHTEAWETFVATAPMATFLHTRKFLSYHGDKFKDRSLLIYSKEGALEGAFVAAEDPKDKSRVISHPGITYGGLLHQGMTGGNQMRAMLEAVREHYKAQGVKTLLYKAIPSFYHRMPAEEDEWALSALGAILVRTDLSRVINLTEPLVWGDKRKRGYHKAEKAGVITKQGTAFASHLFEVTKDNLSRKHGVSPVHTREDIETLVKRFPNEIDYIVAVLDDTIIAGAMMFITPTVVHIQYGSSSEKGYETGALEMVYYHAIEYAKAAGKRYFSFGISTEEEGRVLNETLDRFKKKFSAGGINHRFYVLDC